MLIHTYIRLCRSIHGDFSTDLSSILGQAHGELHGTPVNNAELEVKEACTQPTSDVHVQLKYLHGGHAQALWGFQRQYDNNKTCANLSKDVDVWPP
jgi:hypothetical protein